MQYGLRLDGVQLNPAVLPAPPDVDILVTYGGDAAACDAEVVPIYYEDALSFFLVVAVSPADVTLLEAALVTQWTVTFDASGMILEFFFCEVSSFMYKCHP